LQPELTSVTAKFARHGNFAIAILSAQQALLLIIILLLLLSLRNSICR
jgi:hypothetical protein